MPAYVLSHSKWVRSVAGTVLFALILSLLAPEIVSAQGVDASPPDQTVKLIFIHHSCGENWLKDEDGVLGRALGQSNYFVSDTNYGWGPDGIGDRTDIVDWPEWFTGPESSRYMTALFSEGGQLSDYTRPLPDPGGENRIVLFKSCFPNSNIEGKPTDPPARGEGLTVGNAKAIYNELLTYFATRPDKLFVAITSPPVQDPTYADNARAFTTWLVTEWLAGYAGSNVAVWDFYNVLTDPENHHRVSNGTVEYITNRGANTLHYPTDGDDHPNPLGNRKATNEFVPMLNVFYHRWQAGRPATPPAVSTRAAAAAEPTAHSTSTDEPEGAPAATEEAPAGIPPDLGDMLLDFESESGDWAGFTDDQGSTELTCGRREGEARSGRAALHIEYDIATGGWANCSLVYEEPADWRGAAGLAFYLHSGEVGRPVTLIVYGGTEPDALKPYLSGAVTTQEAVEGWQRVAVGWDAFRQPEWEGDATVRLDPGRVMGIGFSFEDGSRGWLRVDDVSFLTTDSAMPSAAPTEWEPTAVSTEPTRAPSPTPTAVPSDATPAPQSRNGFCRGSATAGLMAVAPAFWLGIRPQGKGSSFSQGRVRKR